MCAILIDEASMSSSDQPGGGQGAAHALNALAMPVALRFTDHTLSTIMQPDCGGGVARPASRDRSPPSEGVLAASGAGSGRLRSPIPGADPRHISPIRQARLEPLMRRTRGTRSVTIGLVDGPVDTGHPGLAGASIRHLGSAGKVPRGGVAEPALRHGTFMAGCLVAGRETPAPGLAPECRLLVRPVFGVPQPGDPVPSCRATDAAESVVRLVDAGASVINLSLGLWSRSTQIDSVLEQAFDYAMRRGVQVVLATGNHACLGSCNVTRHAWVIPVAAAEWNGQPWPRSNLGHWVARNGVMGPGVAVTSTVPGGGYAPMNGTSVAAAIVTGTVALLRSLAPGISGQELRAALTLHPGSRRLQPFAPPLLDAEASLRRVRAAEKWSGPLPPRRRSS